MCVVCGCSGGDAAKLEGAPAHAHDHDHGHDHVHPHTHPHPHEHGHAHHAHEAVGAPQVDAATGDLHYGAGAARVSVPGMSQARAIQIETDRKSVV